MRNFFKLNSKGEPKKKFNKKRIYVDYAASTPLDPYILKKMNQYWNTSFGNAGSIHQDGIDSKHVLNESRVAIAQSISSKPEEIIFTGSGTESNNLAILGYVRALEKTGTPLRNLHIITDSAEHLSVLDCFRFLKEKGVSVDTIDFDERGLVNPKELRKLFRKETVFISISYVNNEIGTVQPIKEISKEIRSYEKETGAKIVFHTDASQAPLYFDCTPNYLGIDLMTIDGQKIYGPKGVGFLYKQNGIYLEPILKGGNQEYGLRPGTENIPLIVGMRESFVKAVSNRDRETKKIKELQEYFMLLLKQHIPQAILNGDAKFRTPSNINISIPGIDSEYLAIALDEHGISVATKSACIGNDSKTLSYVIASLYKDKNNGDTNIINALRFSIGNAITKKDIEYIISILSEEVEKLDSAVL